MILTHCVVFSTFIVIWSLMTVNSEANNNFTVQNYEPIKMCDFEQGCIIRFLKQRKVLDLQEKLEIIQVLVSNRLVSTAHM